MDYKKDAKKEIKSGLFFFRFFIVIAILSHLGSLFELPFIHKVDFFGGEYLTQLVVLVAFYNLFKMLKIIINLLLDIREKVS